jgi:hypothetical protein
MAVIGFGQALASGVFATTQQIAIALGIAGVGTALFAVAADHGFGTAR